MKFTVTEATGWFSCISHGEYGNFRTAIRALCGYCDGRNRRSSLGSRLSIETGSRRTRLTDRPPDAKWVMDRPSSHRENGPKNVIKRKRRIINEKRPADHPFRFKSASKMIAKRGRNAIAYSPEMPPTSPLKAQTAGGGEGDSTCPRRPCRARPAPPRGGRWARGRASRTHSSGRSRGRTARWTDRHRARRRCRA